jgi:hypothetical protein
LAIGGVAKASLDSAAAGDGWATLAFRDVEIQAGQDIAVAVSGEPLRLDYVQLNSR